METKKGRDYIYYQAFMVEVKYIKEDIDLLYSLLSDEEKIELDKYREVLKLYDVSFLEEDLQNDLFFKIGIMFGFKNLDSLKNIF